MSDLPPSIRATYDSRETGPAYWVTTMVNDRASVFRQPIDDPFVRTTMRIALVDILRGLLRRGCLVVEVTVGADVERMNDVLELDENTLIHGRARQAAFQQSIHQKLRTFTEEQG